MSETDAKITASVSPKEVGHVQQQTAEVAADAVTPQRGTAGRSGSAAAPTRQQGDQARPASGDVEMTEKRPREEGAGRRETMDARGETLDARNIVEHSQQEAPGAKPLIAQNVVVPPAPKPRPKR